MTVQKHKSEAVMFKCIIIYSKQEEILRQWPFRVSLEILEKYHSFESSGSPLLRRAILSVFTKRFNLLGEVVGRHVGHCFRQCYHFGFTQYWLWTILDYERCSSYPSFASVHYERSVILHYFIVQISLYSNLILSELT